MSDTNVVPRFWSIPKLFFCYGFCWCRGAVLPLIQKLQWITGTVALWTDGSMNLENVRESGFEETKSDRDRIKGLSHMTGTNQSKTNLSGVLSFNEVWSQKSIIYLLGNSPSLSPFNIISVGQNAVPTGKRSKCVWDKIFNVLNSTSGRRQMHNWHLCRSMDAYFGKFTVLMIIPGTLS